MSQTRINKKNSNTPNFEFQNPWEKLVLLGLDYRLLLYVLGKINDIIFINEMMFFPTDIETKLEALHESINPGSW